MGALTAPVAGALGSGGAYGVGGGHYPGGLRQLDRHRVDVDSDYVSCNFFRSLSATNCLNG